MDKDQFDFIYPLCRDYPWLASSCPKHSVEQLFFRECKTVEERELIKNLITRLSYVAEDSLKSYMEFLAQDCISSKGCTPDNSIFLAMAMDDSPDSSQLFIYALQIQLGHADIKWKDALCLNRVSKFEKHLRSRDGIKHIFLIDEFIGSGQTVIGRLKLCIRAIRSLGKKIEDYHFHVKVLASMSGAIDRIKKSFVGTQLDISSQIILQKGITYYASSPKEAIHQLDIMKRLENNNLAAQYKGTPLPSLGYGQAEALYYRERGNVPNNVFPIFWWPQNQNNEDRITLFTRSGKV